MRALRLAMVGAVSLMLVGSLGAAAQSEAVEPCHPRHGHRSVWDDSQMEFTSEGDVNYGRGMLITETYEWSDPRLPAVKHSIMNFNSYAGEGGDRGIMGQTTIRLEGPDGAWTGGATTMQYVDGRGVGWDTYFGEGAYEGLVAVLQCTSEGCEGQDLRRRATPLPDPVEPSAE